MGRVLLVLTMLLPSLGFGLITFSVPASPTEPMPNYWSGTNCRASAVAILAGGGSYAITRLQMKIGGIIVFDQTRPYDPEDPPVPNKWFLHMMFDSTHFSDGSSVSIVVTAWDQLGRAFVSPTRSAVVYNWAALLARYDLDVDAKAWSSSSSSWVEPIDPYAWRCSDITSSVFAASNIKVTSVTNSLGWTDADLLPQLQTCTAFWVYSHGNSDTINGGFFETDRRDAHFETTPPSLSPQLMRGGYSNLPNHVPTQPTRSLAVGSGGVPPFNSGFPPINLAVLWACNDATKAIGSPYYSLPHSLVWPGYNFFTQAGPTIENQAVVGTAPGMFVLTTAWRPVTETFFQTLYEGRTVHNARIEAYLTHKDLTGGPANYDLFLLVWGDYATRMRGVYTGMNDTTLAFSRQMSGW